MLWENVADPCDVYQCTRLFKQVFNMKSTPEHSIKLESQAYRIINKASRHLSSPNIPTSSPYSITINKENISASCDHHQSLGSPPLKIMNATNKKAKRCPLDDFDQNSQDSGYGASYPDSEDHQMDKEYNGFRFTEPSGLPPRKMSMDIRNNPILSPCNQKSSLNFMKKLSSGYESMDDGFNELIDTDSLIDNTDIMPKNLSNLLSGPILSNIKNNNNNTYSNRNNNRDCSMEYDVSPTIEFRRTRLLRRSLSGQNNNKNHLNTPPTSRVRSCLFRSPNAKSSVSKLIFNDKPRSLFTSSPSSPLLSTIQLSSSPSSPSLLTTPSPLRPFKRPEPPSDISPLIKRFKKSTPIDKDESPMKISMIITKERNNTIPIKRCLSESDANAHIKSAIHRSVTDSDLTGDFSKPCILPLAEGHHEDLKSITPDTLSKLICGEFKDLVDSFKIIDCRYPYEYEAGHIQGAINLYTKNLIEEYLMNPIMKTPQILPMTNKRSILVFHCEFSWERGPNLSRYLRNVDRKLNKEYYPALHYPEIYLLHGGYKSFYREQRNLCTPQGYRPMTHPDHEADLKKFRNKSKSWQGEKTKITNFSARSNLKRLGL